MKRKKNSSSVELDPDEHHCLNCGWAEEDADLRFCVQCLERVSCRECRTDGGKCPSCVQYDLPDNFRVAGPQTPGIGSRCGMLGGHLKDVPKPHRFWYDEAEGNIMVVTVRSLVWAGIGQHWHTTVKEDENPIWDETEQCWKSCWDHPKTPWMETNCDYAAYDQARDWIRKTLIDRFGEKDLVIVKFDTSEPQRWFYKREGD